MSKSDDYPLKDYYRKIYKNYDLVNRLFTFGRDKHWRSKASREIVKGGPAAILDICTGTGDLLFEIHRQLKSETRLVGFDFSREMLAKARQKAEFLQKGNIRFIEGEVSSMPFQDNEFDAAGISFGIRNLLYKNPDAGRHLEEIFRILKPGGKFVILESANPSCPVWRFVNNIYLRLILPYLGGWISGSTKAYKYLSDSSRGYYTLNEMEEVMKDSGFRSDFKQSLFMGSVMLLSVIKHAG